MTLDSNRSASLNVNPTANDKFVKSVVFGEIQKFLRMPWQLTPHYFETVYTPPALRFHYHNKTVADNYVISCSVQTMVT